MTKSQIDVILTPCLIRLKEATDNERHDVAGQLALAAKCLLEFKVDDEGGGDNDRD